MPSFASLLKKIPPRCAGGIFFAAVVLLTLWRTWRHRYYISFADEAENMVGGWLLSRGWTLYDGFFSHHMPVPFFLGALASLLIPGDDIGHYRLVTWFCWCLVAFSVLYSPALKARRDLAFLAAGLVLLTLSLVAHHWWGHLFMADSVWGCLFACFVALFLFPELCGDKPSLLHARLGGLGLGLAVLSSHVAALTSLACLFPWAFSSQAQGWKESLARAKGVAQGILAAVAVTTLLLALFGSLRGFWIQALEFNLDAYPRFALLDPQTQQRVSVFWATLVGQAKFLLTVRPLFYVGLGLMVAAVGLARRHRFAWIAAFLSLTVICGFTSMRGGIRDLYVHDAPFFILAILAGPLGMARLSAVKQSPWLWRLAAVFLAVGAFELSNHGDKTWYQSDDPFAWSPQLKSPVEHIRANSRPADKISVFTYQPVVYLLAQREPAQNTTFYLPWVEWWEQHVSRGGSACQQMQKNRPKFIYYGGSWDWGLNPCIKDWMKGRYEIVLEEKPIKLWRRLP